MSNQILHYMSLVMRKPAFCICENKDADQLCGNRQADQRLCFRYTDSTIPPLPKCKMSSLKPSSVAVQPGLCQTLSETLITGFLTTRLIKIKDHCLILIINYYYYMLLFTNSDFSNQNKTVQLICAFVLHLQKAVFLKPWLK